MKRYLVLFVLLSISIMSFAQNKFTISGTITEQNKGEALIGVKVRVKDQSYLVATNEYGFYSITIPEGKYILVVTYIGYIYPKKKRLT
jgi:predicted CDP-diglyceride synthetase/phosphatidate cytidylyltransferase